MFAKGMRAAFCKVLEYIPDKDRLLVRSGVGWRPGVVGHSTLGIEKDFPAGFVFQTGKPVISNHLEHERRFQTPPLLAEHGVKRSVTVPITLARGHPWGVLAADSPDEGQFDAPDIAFMQGVAQLLGAAIQRLRNEGALRAGEERFRSLYEAQQTPHLVLSTDFIIEAASPAYLKATMTRAKDLVGRNFAAGEPDQLWVADITYVRSREGFVYLAFILDACSRRVVGWSMASHLRTELVVDALQMAIARRKGAAGLVHHSDRGVRYTSLSFGKRLEDEGLVPSMGRVGSAYDSALAESFVATLKTELLYRSSWPTRLVARTAIFEYIEGFYNTRRRHSALGYLSPAEFEEVRLEGKDAA
jgi:transposase InsO family protein